MRLKLKVDKRVKVSPLSTKIYEAGYEGEFDDTLGVSWIEAGEAEECQAEDVTDPVLTSEQIQVLGQAANEIIAAQSEDGGQIDLNAMKADELREIAVKAEIPGAKKMKKPELVEALQAAIDAEATSGAGTDSESGAE